jgi:hypothetical protein
MPHLTLKSWRSVAKKDIGIFIRKNATAFAGMKSCLPRSCKLGPNGLPTKVQSSPLPILDEVQQLYNVSDRLDLLAEQHPLVSEALIGISVSVRNTATLLQLVVAMKCRRSPE